jgi:hypothetical protein
MSDTDFSKLNRGSLTIATGSIVRAFGYAAEPFPSVGAWLGSSRWLPSAGARR